MARVRNSSMTGTSLGHALLHWPQPTQAVVRQAHHPERSRRRIQYFQFFMKTKETATKVSGTFCYVIKIIPNGNSIVLERLQHE
jgi:hypothetical protein